MTNSSKRIKGKAEEVKGSILKTAGKLLGNEKLQAQGQAKELEGEARQEVAKAGERLKGTGQEIKGTIKASVGKVLGNEQMQVEGAAKKLEGAARKILNR